MKTLLIVMLTALALPVVAYQTVGVSRANFGSQRGEENATAEQQGGKTRSFTSYGSRTGAWSKGVQTKTVETKAVETRSVQTQTAARPAATKSTDKKAEEKAPQATTAQVTAPDKPVANKPGNKADQQTAADPAAAMQQLQGLQSMMGALGGSGEGMPDLSAIMNSAAGAQGGKGGAAAGAAKMPDMSALMGGAAGGAGAGKKK